MDIISDTGFTCCSTHLWRFEVAYIVHQAKQYTAEVGVDVFRQGVHDPGGIPGVNSPANAMSTAVNKPNTL